MTARSDAFDGPWMGTSASSTSQSEPRIGYLTSQYPAASHTFIRREVIALRELGHLIDTFSVRQPTSPRLSDADLEETRNTFYILPASRSGLVITHLRSLLQRPIAYLKTLSLALRHRPPGLLPLLWSLFYFAEAIILAAELRRRGVTRLHNHFANAAATVGYLASHFLNLPWSLTLHGISETDYPAGLTLARKIEAAEFVACASWFGRAQAMRITPNGHWDKMVVVRCGLQLQNMPQRRCTSDMSPSLQLVCVGRLSPEKGILGLLTAVDILRRRGLSVVLQVVGDGPDREQVETMISALRLGNCVKLRGQLDEAETLQVIAESDLFVLPSFMEGLPVVLMEAMAIGVPVIAPRVAGIPELVEDGRLGLLFHPSNWEDLADRMQTLLTDPDMQTRFVIAARKKVEAEFDIQNAVSPLADRFELPAQPQR